MKHNEQESVLVNQAVQGNQEALEAILSSVQDMVYNLSPVSYTHLDVYKRQGDNSKAALMTRGITEIARLGVAMGAKTETFAGLSGIGDLIVTCTSMHSRNRRAGILIGQGIPAPQAVEQIGMTVEGYLCAKSAHELAQKARVDMPIIEQAYQVLYEGKSPQDGIRDPSTAAS